MKQILVTGGAGYIGSAVATALHKQGNQVTVFDDHSTGQPGKLSSDIRSLHGDITNLKELMAVAEGVSFDVVVHCAAKKAVGESEEDPSLYFHTNVTGSLNVLRVVEQRKIPHLIFSSTAAVYDTAVLSGAITERHHLAPVNVYGQTKEIVERMIQTYARLGKLSRYTIFRYFNVAGDAGLHHREEAAQNIFPCIAKAVRDKKEFSIFGDDYDTKDGTGVRDYIHLKDLISAHEQVIEGEVSGIFNLGTGTGYSVKEVVRAFDEALPNPVPAVIAVRRPGDPAELVADATHARETFGWVPNHSLKDMVEDTIATYL
jgi:UDP-glucose 4-epimerase